MDALDQRAVRDPLTQHRDNDVLFHAAVLAIWSSAPRWATVMKRQRDVAAALHGYDPDVISVDGVFSIERAPLPVPASGTPRDDVLICGSAGKAPLTWKNLPSSH